MRSQDSQASQRSCSQGLDIWLAGGASVVNQYLAARLVDEIDISIAALILGTGAPLFEGLDRGTLKLKQIRAIESAAIRGYRRDFRH